MGPALRDFVREVELYSPPRRGYDPPSHHGRAGMARWIVMEVRLVNKRRLGRGLDSLLGTDEGGFEASSLEAADLLHLAVEKIDANPFQPRKTFDPAEIATLAQSVKQHGMLQPVIVRAVGDRYQLIAGERRLRASMEAQLHTIPARVMVLDDRRVSELAMVENLQREDLNALEKAHAFRDYLKRYGGTQEELAGRLAAGDPVDGCFAPPPLAIAHQLIKAWAGE